jgi:serine/threonine protein kinase
MAGASDGSTAKPSAGARQLGQYRLIKKLGEGAMGAVFLAEDTVALRNVALKILPKRLAGDGNFLARFQREARATGKLNHANIIAAYDVGEDQGLHYYVMEYAEGESLDRILKRQGYMAWKQALEIAAQVASGLKHAHDHGFIHRDIKPANLLLTPEGTAKILDLGLSKEISDSQSAFTTLSGTTVGTPQYISPEQARGEKKIDGRCDIYSLGATLYHLITGHPPFDGATSAAIMARHLTDAPPNACEIRKSLPPAVAQLIQKAMSKDPAGRFADCGAFRHALEKALKAAGEPAPTAEERSAQHAKSPGTKAARTHKHLSERDERKSSAKRDSSPVIWVGVGVVGIAAILAFVSLGGKKHEPKVKTATATPVLAPPPATPIPQTPAPIQPPANATPVAPPPVQTPPATAEIVGMEHPPANATTLTPKDTSAPMPDPIPAPAPTLPVAMEVQPAAKPPADSNATAPVEPKKTAPALPYDKALELALSPESLAALAPRLQQAPAFDKPEDEERWKLLADLVSKAGAVEAAAVEYLSAQSGKEVTLTLPTGVKRVAKVNSISADSVEFEGFGAQKIGDLTLGSLREFTHAKLGSDKPAEAQLAAYMLLRGDPAIAKNLFRVAAVDWRPGHDTITQVRQAAVREAQAASEVKKFTELLEQSKHAQARSLGAELLKKFSGTRAVSALTPSLEEQLAELDAEAAGLQGVFLCDFKRRPDGKVELTFDPNKKEHVNELVNRGLPAYFTDVEVDMELDSDGRWERVLHLGDTCFYQHLIGSQSIEHLGKKSTWTPAVLPKFTGEQMAPNGHHRYRMKAGPSGASFQIDDQPEQTVPGAWPGGRLQWPGHNPNQILPLKLQVVGKLDPQWLAEMAEVAKDRAKYLSGAWVDLKLKTKRNPRTEWSPNVEGYIYSRDKQTRTIAGWNEFGDAWTLQDNELISPRPQKKTGWESVLWPAALISHNAELEFEAKIDAGQLRVNLAGDYKGLYYDARDHIILEPAKVRVAQSTTFFSSLPTEPTKEEKVINQAELPPKAGQWRRYHVILDKGAVHLAIDGSPVLDAKVAHGGNRCMSFYVFPGSEVRLRNIRIHKME